MVHTSTTPSGGTRVNSGGKWLVSVHVVRPHAHILRQYTLAVAACLIPLFALLYWVARSPETSVYLVIGIVVVPVVLVLASIGHKRAFIQITPTGITERGFFGRTHTVPASTVGSIILLELYQSGSLDTHTQLFVIDSDGHLLLRMRGQFWSPTSMETVVDALDVPVVRVPEPLSLRDLNRLRPELLYWFERRHGINGRPRSNREAGAQRQEPESS